MTRRSTTKVKYFTSW